MANNFKKEPFKKEEGNEQQKPGQGGQYPQQKKGQQPPQPQPKPTMPGGNGRYNPKNIAEEEEEEEKKKW